MSRLLLQTASEPVASCSSSCTASSFARLPRGISGRASSHGPSQYPELRTALASTLRPYALRTSGYAHESLISSWRMLSCRSGLSEPSMVCRNSLPGRQQSAYDEDDYPLEMPTKFELMQRPDKQKPLVRVRLSVHFRVHSRQMLCIGGSQIPMGWSFLSISRVPMTWNNGDIWTVEVDLQAGQRIEYKYVILEEQDWTKIEDQEWQGLVEISYRSGPHPGKPPDVGVIQKQMAIVAWQPGPNRVLQVPTERELLDLQVGQAMQGGSSKTVYEKGIRTNRSPSTLHSDPFKGTWEVMATDDEGQPFLDRHDVWGWVPVDGAKPANNLKGYNFGDD